MTSDAQNSDTPMQHSVMGAIGAAAGLAMWVLFEVLRENVDNARLLLWTVSATLGFFVLLFALRGSLRWRDAVLGAGVLALADAALLYWASERFLEFDDLFEESLVPLAWSVVLFIGAPFTVALFKGRAGDYGLLFDTSWNIVVRYIAAWLFVGLFWGLLFLSDALLRVVGVTLIERLIDLDPMPYVLTGAAVGLGLSVAQDLRAYVSPYLPLRLLRLLLPMVLVVITIFILALPFRGLSDLFGNLSAATILMSVTIAGITLITSALDKNEEEGVRSTLMTLAVRGLALLLPVLAGLVVWALWLRVSEYGWTPARIAASLASLLVMASALLYGLAVFQKAAWQQMIRQANIGMALTILGLAVLWMTPLMNAQRMSAQTQVERYLIGTVELADVPVWELMNTWGEAGREAAMRLKAYESNEQAKLHALLDRAERQSRWEFNRNQDKISEQLLSKQVVSAVQIWPEGQSVAEDYFAKALHGQLEDWAEICVKSDARPCVLVFGPFRAQGVENAMFIVPQAESGARVFEAGPPIGAPDFFSRPNVGEGRADLSEAAYEQLRAGGYRIGPSSQQSLWLGDLEISSNN